MQLRSYSESHLLWTDALCINQASDKEKSEQVPLMGEIYSKAIKVFAWLGEADCGSDLIFDVLQEFRKRKRQGHHHINFDAAEEFSYYRELFRGIYKEKAGRLSEESNEHDGMLHEELNWLRPLYCRPYWQRVWILQEAVLAKSLVVCCGEKSIDFEDIYGLSLDWGSFEQGFSTQNYRLSEQDSKGWNTIQAICGHRRRIETTCPPETPTLLPGDVATLQEVIEIYAGDHLCADPKDRVYGFRTLVRQWKDLVVNYEQSVLEVFLDAAKPELFDPAVGGGSYLAFRLFSAMGLGSRKTFDELLPCIYVADLRHEAGRRYTLQPSIEA